MSPWSEQQLEKFSFMASRHATALASIPQVVASPIHAKILRKRFTVKAATSGDSKNGSGRPSMVDADILVLRKRIRQLRMEEINHVPPQHWMEWEKRWYASYDSDVCASLAWLQSILLNMRPSIAMGVLALFSFSVPASALLLLMELSYNFRG